MGTENALIPKCNKSINSNILRIQCDTIGRFLKVINNKLRIKVEKRYWGNLKKD